MAKRIGRACSSRLHVGHADKRRERKSEPEPVEMEPLSRARRADFTIEVLQTDVRRSPEVNYYPNSIEEKE
jgi:hypothetical protein